MLVALDLTLSNPRQIVIAGEPGAAETRALVAEVHRHFVPNKILAPGGWRRGTEVSRRKTGSACAA